jgi:carboxylesterase
VLCLHGFTGTPYEVAPVARALGEAGFAVSAPLLAGHGHDARHLAGTGWRDWLDSAEKAMDDLRAAAGTETSAIVGFSMGGLLALRLARLRPAKTSALVVVAAPLRLPRWQVALTLAWSRLPRFLRQGKLASIRKREGSDVTDPTVRMENPGLDELPLAGVAEVIRLGRVVRGDLASVRAPVLVAHGERDHTVPLHASRELVTHLASDRVEQVWLPRSGHLAGVDVEHATLSQAVVRFLSMNTQPRGVA